MADTILSEADAVDADAIVLGSRGRGGIGSFLVGSVSHAVLQSADRPVLIVPSPQVARERAERRHGRG
jgi:nucleotide-binding universal stress UspA family protein